MKLQTADRISSILAGITIAIIFVSLIGLIYCAVFVVKLLIG